MRISGTSHTPKPSDLLPPDLQEHMISHLEVQLEQAQAATIEAKAAIGTAEAELAAARRAEREAIEEACAGGVILPCNAHLNHEGKIVAEPVTLRPGVGVRGLDEESQEASKAVQAMGARLQVVRTTYQLAAMHERNIKGALARCQKGLVPTVQTIAETLRSKPLFGKALLDRAAPTPKELRDQAKEADSHFGTVVAFEGVGAIRLPHWLRRPR